MQPRRLPVTLDADLYEKLAQQAKQHDRDVYQEARAIMRRALSRVPRSSPEKQRVS
jgi:plasmid stability protein